MFYWTKKLHVKMADLEREVNPFQLTTLRQWLENSSKSPIDLPSMEVDGEGIENGNDNAEGCHDPSSAETTLSLTASAEFWAVPTPDLRLVSKVAAGAGGTVWKASYRGKIVAAKQLFALQTPSQREEGLKELAHEVGHVAMQRVAYCSLVELAGCRNSKCCELLLCPTARGRLQSWANSTIRQLYGFLVYGARGSKTTTALTTHSLFRNGARGICVWRWTLAPPNGTQLGGVGGSIAMQMSCLQGALFCRCCSSV